MVDEAGPCPVEDVRFHRASLGAYSTYLRTVPLANVVNPAQVYQEDRNSCYFVFCKSFTVMSLLDY